jgi:hypothetical protein
MASMMNTSRIPARLVDSGALKALFVKVLQYDSLPSLSFTDPWGTAVALGAKRNETRSWPAATRYWKGPLAIHIASTVTPEAKALCGQEPFCRVLEAAGYSWTPRSGFKWNLPLKQVIALAWLEYVEPITPSYCVDPQERLFGNYAAGRYAWKFGAVYRLKQPIVATGRLGVWQWTPSDSFWTEIQGQLDLLQGGQT